jgi:hypothetical protein
MTGVQRFDLRDCIGQYKLYYLVRSMHIFVILLCVLNVFARIAIAAVSAESALLHLKAVAACDAGGNDARSVTDQQQPFNNLDTVLTNAVAASCVLEAAVLVLTVGAFLLFFPTCIVMFRRVERRLDAIMQEMNLRSDLGTVFLPYEFSPAAADGARSQVEMQVVEARAFLSRLKTAAAAQEWKFFLCLLLVLLALVARMSLAVFLSTLIGAHTPCQRCDSCQSVEGLKKLWFSHTPLMVPLVYSTCSTLPLLFSLWLMITKHDRELMLHPGRFRPDRTSLQPVDGEMELRLNAERMRMGVDLT